MPILQTGISSWIALKTYLEAKQTNQEEADTYTFNWNAFPLANLGNM